VGGNFREVGQDVSNAGKNEILELGREAIMELGH
jgi:hypothetical protein